MHPIAGLPDDCVVAEIFLDSATDFWTESF